MPKIAVLECGRIHADNPFLSVAKGRSTHTSELEQG
jgi:hypothetical protein